MREVRLRLASEAAAEQRHVHGDVVRRHAQSLGDQVTRGLRRLEAAPHLALAVRDARGRGGRLHRRVREVRHVVLGLVTTRGAGRGRREIAVVADHLGGLARRLLERRLVGHRVVARVRAVVPGDLERPAPLHRGPGVAGEHGDATDRVELGGSRTAFDRHDALDARHLERFRRIEARHLAAVHGRTRDDGVQHAVEPGVDAVLRLPGRDVAAVDQLQLTFPDVAELLRVLETHRLARGHGLSGGRLGERSVPEPAARGAMHDLVVPGFHLARRHLPALGGGRLEHRARRRAATAHRLEEVPRAPRAVGVLVAEALLVAGRLRDADALPVGLELVGHDHGHAGPDALPHLGPMADDRDHAVLGDRHERQRVIDPAVRHPIRAVLLGLLRAGGRRIADREHEPAEREALQRSGAGSRWRAIGGVHRAPPFAAACLMAARIRV